MDVKKLLKDAYMSGVTEAQIAEQVTNMSFDFDGMAWAYAQSKVENITASVVMPRISHFIDENDNTVDINAAGVNTGMTRHGTVIHWLGMGFAGEKKTLTPVYEAYQINTTKKINQ